MHKTGKYTILTGLLAIAFIALSLFCVRLLLGKWEEKLLTERGSLEFALPVRDWQEMGADQASSGEKELTMEQIEDIIDIWNQRNAMLIHSPVEGQISIDEAIEAAKNWLEKMEITKFTKKASSGDGSIQATLNQGRKKGEKWELKGPGYSFWVVEYKRSDMEAIFYVNAVTGQVWSAQIWLEEFQAEDMETVYLENGVMQLKRFIKLAGFKDKEGQILKENAYKDVSDKATSLYEADVSEVEDNYLHLETEIQDSNLKASLFCSWFDNTGNKQSVDNAYDVDAVSVRTDADNTMQMAMNFDILLKK